MEYRSRVQAVLYGFSLTILSRRAELYGTGRFFLFVAGASICRVLFSDEMIYLPDVLSILRARLC